MNAKIREDIKKSNLKCWEVAKEIGVSPFTFSVWLREELTGKRLTKTMEAVKRLAQEREGFADGK